MLRRSKKHTGSLTPPVFPTGNVQPSYAWSIRLYVREVFLRFRSIVGIALLLFGYAADLVSGFKVPPVVFALLFVCGFVVANFLLFHQLRGVTLDESLGLPQWAHGALNAGGGGSHLTVIHYGFPATEPFTSNQYLDVRKKAAEHFAIPESEFDTRSYTAGYGYSGGMQLDYPKGMSNPVLTIQLGINHSGAFKVKWRTLADPVKIEWVLGAIDLSLSFVLSQAIYRHVISPPKLRHCILSLSDWPRALDGSAIANATVFSQPRLNGFRNHRDYRLTKSTDRWQLAVEFAKVLLTDSGYVGFEAGLAELSRDQCVAIFKDRVKIDVADQVGATKSS